MDEEIAVHIRNYLVVLYENKPDYFKEQFGEHGFRVLKSIIEDLSKHLGVNGIRD
jgi:hypothetical protein